MSENKIGFTVREYMGCEIKKFNEDGTVNMSELTKYEDIKVGMVIALPTMTGFFKATVEDGMKFASNGKWGGILEFNKDDRQCWVCGGVINLRGVEKVNKNTIVGM